MFQLLLLVALTHYAAASVVTAPTASITSAPLKKRETSTAGYRSTGYADGTTLWGTVIHTLDAGQYMSTSGSLYRRCASSTTCRFFSCSGGYVVFSTSSSYCGTSVGSTCSYDVSYTDISDTRPKTNYWCDENTLNGWKIFAKTPSGSSSSSRLITTTSSSPPIITSTSTSISSSSISFSSSSRRTEPIPDPTPIPAPESKSTPIAPIVGGVVGGIAIISIAVAVVVIVLRRKKNTPSPAPAVSNQPVYYQPQGQFPAADHAYAKTPGVMSTNVNPYYVNSGSGPTSPVPQYTPYSPNNPAANELPVLRM